MKQASPKCNLLTDNGTYKGLSRPSRKYCNHSTSSAFIFCYTLGVFGGFGYIPINSSAWFSSSLADEATSLRNTCTAWLFSHPNAFWNILELFDASSELRFVDGFVHTDKMHLFSSLQWMRTRNWKWEKWLGNIMVYLIYAGHLIRRRCKCSNHFWF